MGVISIMLIYIIISLPYYYFILIISSFYHPQAYVLEVLVTPALRVTGFSLFVFIHNILSLKIHNAKLQIKFRINIYLSIFYKKLL